MPKRRLDATHFSCFQLSRHLDYPVVPRIIQIKELEDPAVADLRRKLELLEKKLQLLQEELRGGINLERFYVKE